MTLKKGFSVEFKEKNVNTIKNHLLFNNSFDFKKWFVLSVVGFECVLG